MRVREKLIATPGLGRQKANLEKSGKIKVRGPAENLKNNELEFLKMSK